MENQFEYEAKLFLEKLQEQVYSFYNIPFISQEREADALYVDDAFIIEWLKSRNTSYNKVTVENFKKEWEEIRIKSQADKTTKYEIAEWYSLLSDVVKEFEEVFKILSYKPPENYLFGTLPTNRVNGMAMKVPENPYKLVILETGLFGFANLMCKSIASSFIFKITENGMLNFSTDVNECKNHINQNSIIVERFFEVLVSYVVLGNPHHAKQYFLEENYTPLADLLRNGFEYFVFAHEFGHLIAGHLDSDINAGYDIANSETNEIITNWKQEFEADFIGTNILIHVMQRRGFDISLSYWGIEVFFGCIDAVEKTLSILKFGSIDMDTLSETHPPTLMRRERIRDVVSKSFDAETVKAIISISKVMEEIIDYLWLKVEPKIYELKQNDIKPSNHWL